ncbi:hypothetical protein BOH66_16300 [Microbacterium aurum]|uniref:Uncharacterized protein n=2 Tax=Microbacterium aurum TaxID=36805 RepID=A0A1P8UBV8_9MICO|nr:hypothetical protein BOH66_16300 [Microbacterium aurum]
MSAQWSEADPGAGSPADIRAGAGMNSTVASRAADALGDLSAAGAAREQGWQATASTALASGLTSGSAELQQITEQATADANALSAYATQVESIKMRQTSITSQIDQATSRMRVLRRDLELWDDPDLIERSESRIADTQWRLRGLNTQLDQLANERAAADNAALIALGGITSRGTLAAWSTPGAPASVTLGQLAGMSETDIATLLAAHPELIDKLLTAQTPAQTAAWWQSLTLDQQHALVLGGSTLIGALDGLPPAIRVAANRINAANQLPDLERRQFTADFDHLVTVNTNFVDPHLVNYLRRVADGDVQLYLWRPEKGAIIEMAGDPRTAKSALFVVPGTNASISEFTSDNPTTRFASWQVEKSASHSVLAFTVLTGPMPYLTPAPVDFWSNGPQNNAFASARAPELAAFERGIFAAIPAVPTVSYEHSYATAVGSAAEAYGGTPTARVLAGGVGAMYGYEPADNVTRYAIQAPNDVNRIYAGQQAWEVGFGVAPESIRGINILDSGMSGLPINPTIAQLETAVAGPLAVAVQVPAGVESHINLMSDDESVNGTSLRNVRQILSELGSRR